MLLPMVLALATTARPDPGRCAAAVLRTATRDARGVAAALARCARQVAHGTLPAATDCVAATAITRATLADRTSAGVARRCCGRDGVCGTADDVSLDAFGWTTPTCPDFDGAGCAHPLASPADVAACVACDADAAAGEVLALARAVPASPTTAGRCRAAVAAATARAVGAHAAARLACWTAHLRGTRQGGCPAAGDPALAHADAALAAAVCAACGGVDHACGGAADEDPVALGFPAACPPVSRADGASCAHPIASPADLAACLTCTVGRAVDCTARLAVPAATPYPAACDPPRPACEAEVTCTTTLDCPAGYTCLDNGAAGTTRYCVGSGCTGDGDCGGGGVCRQYCARDGFDVTCGARRCQCPGFGCAGPDQLCIDTGGLACRKVCLQDSDCISPFGFVCVNPGFGFGLCIGTVGCQ